MIFRRYYRDVACLFIAVVSGLSASANAQVDELDDEFIISDVELEARESVFVATKTRKTLQEAPAIVTVLTGEDMDRAGFRTLNEALHTVPGFEHSNSGRWDFLFTRGNAFTVSVLINGVPIVSPGDNLVFLDQAYPINIIDRVEVISGPGGILWGANAFLGVVNIVTKKGNDLDGWFVEAGGGSFKTARGAVAFGKQFNDLDVLLFANAQTTTEGSVLVNRQTIGLPPGFRFPPDENPDNPVVYNPDGPPIFQDPDRTDPSNDVFLDFVGQVHWRAFSLFAKFAWEEDYYQISSSTGALLQGRESVDRDPNQIISLGYEKRFLDESLGVHAKSYFWSQNFEVDSVIFPSLPNTIPNDFRINLAIEQQLRYGVNLEIDARVLLWGLENTLLAGVEYFREEISGATIRFFGPNTGNPTPEDELVPDSSTNTFSVYLSDEVNVFERIAVNGGIRFNYSDSYASALLLSSNLVGHIFDGEDLNVYGKLSYTQGYRPPSFEQRFSTQGGFLGNSSIGPERSEAGQIELNAKYRFEEGPLQQVGVRLDYARTVLNDLISLRERSVEPTEPDAEPGTITQYDNLGTRGVDSIEFSGDMVFRGGHRFWLGYSFNDVEDETADEEVHSHSPHIVNFGGIYRMNKYLKLNVRYSWVARKSIDTYVDPVSGEEGVLDINEYHLWSAGIVLNDAQEKYTLLLHAYNMLGQRYETLDGDTVAAPYPYAQPNRPSFLVRLQGRF